MSNKIEIIDSGVNAFRICMDKPLENFEIINSIVSDEEISKFFISDAFVITDDFIDVDLDRIKTVISDNDAVSQNTDISTMKINDIPLGEFIKKKIFDKFPRNTHSSLSDIWLFIKFKKSDPDFSWNDFMHHILTTDSIINSSVSSQRILDDTVNPQGNGSYELTIYDKDQTKYSILFISKDKSSDEYGHVILQLDVDMCKNILPDKDINYIIDIISKIEMYHKDAVNIYHKFMHHIFKDADEYISMIL